jgi:hypothetical protein
MDNGSTLKEAASVLIKGVRRAHARERASGRLSQVSARARFLVRRLAAVTCSSSRYPGLRQCWASSSPPPPPGLTRGAYIARHIRAMHIMTPMRSTMYAECARHVRGSRTYVRVCSPAYLLDAPLSVVLPGRIPLGPITFDLSAGCRR